MNQKKIPSDADFARAAAALAHRSRGLSDIRDNFFLNFKKDRNVVEFFIFDCSEFSFKVYVFFEKEKNIVEAKESGLTETIKNYIFQQLELYGRGKKDDLQVCFEFDSQEDVNKNYEGDYYNRLR